MSSRIARQANVQSLAPVSSNLDKFALCWGQKRVGNVVGIENGDKFGLEPDSGVQDLRERYRNA